MTVTNAKPCGLERSYFGFAFYFPPKGDTQGYWEILTFGWLHGFATISQPEVSFSFFAEDRMDSVLKQLLDKVDEYIGSLIDVADMPPEDRSALKSHLLAAQEILVRNGNDKLQEFVDGVTKALLSRF